MKTSISQEKPKFSPVTLTITAETERELRLLRAIFGGCGIAQCRNWLTGVSYDKELDAEELYTLISKAFEPVHLHCIETGLING